MHGDWSGKYLKDRREMLAEQVKRFRRASLTFAQSGYWLVPISWGLVITFISPRFGTAYSPDSFGYYLLGTNLLAGLGYVSQTIRDFYASPELGFYQPSKSFPPLMPILVGVANRLTGQAITSGLIVNAAVLLAAFNVHFLLSKRIAGKLFWVPFLALPFFVLQNDGTDSFVAEILSGRSFRWLLYFAFRPRCWSVLTN